MKKHLFVLFACLFAVMIGFGITMPVLPFYTERLALAKGASREAVAIHVSLLTSVYALMGLLFAPLWGQWSDKVGRRRLVLIGLAGAAATQVLFGMATSLWLLYGARIAGGVLSSATLPAAAAYVSDVTSREERGRGMAWLGTAVSLGTVVGLALGGMTSPKDLHFFRATFGHFKIDSFSVPFFATAALMLLIFVIALRWLPESLAASDREPVSAGKTNWRQLGGNLRSLLGLAAAGQFGLAMFESTFALYAQEKMGYGPKQVGAVFVVCGLVMAVFQVVAVSFLSRRMEARPQIAAGFGLMGGGILLLLWWHAMPLVLSAVFVLALGMALIAPNLAALTSSRGGSHAGAALGMQSAANSLGQVGGPLLGGVLFAWQAQAPYWFGGVFLLGLAALAGRKEKGDSSC